MGRRGQIAIDRIVALRSSVLPIYVLIRPDGTITAADEVSEDGNDFLTTRMFGDKIAFQSVHGDYLSTEGGQICTRRYCSADERFTVEKLETQYAFRSRTGAYLSVSDRAPFVGLAAQAGDTEMFQLFSLMMYGVNVGQQLDTIDKTGCIQINDLLSSDDIQSLREGVDEAKMNGFAFFGGHETRVPGLAGYTKVLADLATHPLVMQIARRLLSPAMQLASMESCRTDVDHVRKELEVTTWNVVHPYSGAMFPGVVDPRINFTVTWFLDQLDTENSTWAFVKAPLADGACTPQLPHLSSPEEVEAVTSTAQQLLAQSGSAWLCIGPHWMSNNVGAASFWKDYDAQTRYKHLSGQKDAGQSFRALTDAQRTAPLKDEMCPTVIQATYLRENITLRDLAPPPHVLAAYGEAGRQLAELTMSAPTA